MASANNETMADILHASPLDGMTWELLFSKFIGYSILVMSSVFVKLPQLVKIIRAGNADGISYVGELVLTLVSCNTMCYNVLHGYPISTWGESLSLGIQEVITASCLLWFSGRSSDIVVHVIFIVSYVILLLSPLVPLSVHVTLQVLSVPMVSFSKLIQIRTNWVRHSTGQLSRASAIAMTLRTCGRLATSIIETGDFYLIIRYAVLTLLNITILSQIVYYESMARKPKGRKAN